MHHLTTLPNGLRVATAEMPHMASVCVGLWAGVGGRHEPARLNGAAHFLEHLLFKGTRRRSARRITGEVEGVGGYLDAFTAEDHTCYYAKAEAGAAGATRRRAQRTCTCIRGCRRRRSSGNGASSGRKS